MHKTFQDWRDDCCGNLCNTQIAAVHEEAHLQFTIESRQLTNEHSHPPSAGPESARILIEAANADDAITEFVRQSWCELVSFSKPAEGRESIATVKKEDSVFLVRIYSA